MKHRFLSFTIPSLLTFTAIAGTFLIPVESQAKQLSTRELRQLGFTGNYRGVINGTVLFRQNNAPPAPIDQRRVFRRSIVERIPIRRSARVAGPLTLLGGDNTFYTLLHNRATGNSRRVTIRGSYSGSATSSFYPYVFTGTGSKTVQISKRGKRNPRFTMRQRLVLSELRGDGAVYTNFSGSGTLQK